MNSRGLNKSRRITVIAAVVFAALFASLLMVNVFPKIRKETVIKGITQFETRYLAPESTSEHLFVCTMSGFDSMAFFIMDGDATSLSVTLMDSDTGNEVLKNVRITSDMCSPEGKGTVIRLNKPDGTRFEPGHYLVTITNASSSPAELVVEKETGDLTVRIFVKTMTGYIVFAAVCLMLAAFTVTALCVYCRSGSTAELNPENIFLAAAVPLCIAWFFLVPPWSTGDSEAHYLACYRLSNLFLGQSGSSEWMGRTDDVLFYRDNWWSSTTPMTGGYEILKSNFRLFANDRTLIEMTSRSEKMNYYSVFCYIPQTLALVIGRLIGFGPVFNCYLVKAFTAVFYVILCFRAIRKAPYCKGIIAFCAFLPSSLMMSGAFSYEPMVIVTTLNFIASVLLLKESPDDNKALTFACIWTFILGATKGGGYLILLPLLLIVPARKKGFKHLGKFLPMVCGLFSVTLFDMVLPAGSLYQFGSKGNGFMTASFALENPVSYLVMVFKTYPKFGTEMIEDLFGSKLCWGEKVVPLGFSLVMFVVILIIAASDEKLDKLKKSDILIASSVVLIALLSTPAMLLSWTPEGSDVILGIQGHYFMPVLPLFAAVAGKGLRVLSKKTGFTASKAFKVVCASVYPVIFIMTFFAFYFILDLYLTR